MIAIKLIQFFFKTYFSFQNIIVVFDAFSLIKFIFIKQHILFYVSLVYSSKLQSNKSRGKCINKKRLKGLSINYFNFLYEF